MVSFCKENVTEAKRAINRSIHENEYLIKKAREKYEKLCLSCPEQTLRFYAAEVGTFAEDTSKGGRYSNALLDTLEHIPTETNIFQAHNIAAKRVRQESMEQQCPDYSVPKIHDFLPGSIAISKMIY